MVFMHVIQLIRFTCMFNTHCCMCYGIYCDTVCTPNTNCCMLQSFSWYIMIRCVFLSFLKWFWLAERLIWRTTWERGMRQDEGCWLKISTAHPTTSLVGFIKRTTTLLSSSISTNAFIRFQVCVVSLPHSWGIRECSTRIRPRILGLCKFIRSSYIRSLIICRGI